jgi:pantoate--beta-alanine ligase
MKVIHSVKAFSDWRSNLSIRTKVGFVPTMGALHEGHLSLINRSKNENETTIVSIFVNPTQFGPNEDFKKYPRPWREDYQKLTEKKIEILFAPTRNSMYPSYYSTHVEVSGVTETLCASPASRGPEHFVGVATIVAKLFNLVRPHRAYFGLKDYQQVRVIETMNEDLQFGIKIVRCPIVREKDGLAMSSRNKYLSAQDRLLAPKLYQALQYGRKLLRSPNKLTPQLVCQKIRHILTSNPHIRIDYVEAVDPVTLKRVSDRKKALLLAAAVKIGATRLIDNILVH